MGTFVKNTEVRDRIVEMLRSDVPWNRGWKPSCPVPHKTNGQPYSFMLQMQLRHDDEYVGRKALEKAGYAVNPADVEFFYFRDSNRMSKVTETDPATGKKVPVIDPETGEQKLVHSPVFTRVEVVAASRVPGYEPHTFNEPPHPEFSLNSGCEEFIAEFLSREGLSLSTSVECTALAVDDRNGFIEAPHISVCQTPGHYYYQVFRGIALAMLPKVGRRPQDANARELAADIFAAKTSITLGVDPAILPADEKYRRKWAEAVDRRLDIFVMACSKAEKVYDRFFAS